MISIKKHENNKFYVSTAGCYTNLTEIGKLIKAGEKIEVLDHTGTDITAHVLAQVLVKMRNVPVYKLERLIKGE